MSFGEQSNQYLLDSLVLTDDDFAQFVLDVSDGCRGVFRHYWSRISKTICDSAHQADVSQVFWLLRKYFAAAGILFGFVVSDFKNVRDSTMAQCLGPELDCLGWRNHAVKTERR